MLDESNSEAIFGFLLTKVINVFQAFKNSFRRSQALASQNKLVGYPFEERPS